MKHNFFLSLAFAMFPLVTMASAVPEQSEIDEAEQIVAKARETVAEVLNTPILIVSESNDTLYDNTSSAADTGNITITIHSDHENAESVQLTKADLQELNVTRTAIMVGVIAPCITIALIVIVVLIFLLYRYRAKNRIIEKAIENNYQLPDSFYTGTVAPVAKETVVKEEKHDDSSELPPLPKTTPDIPLTPMDKQMITNSIRMVLIGLFIFLFFVFIGAGFVGVLAGGIPFAIGASRLLSYYYFRKIK